MSDSRWLLVAVVAALVCAVVVIVAVLAVAVEVWWLARLGRRVAASNRRLDVAVRDLRSLTQQVAGAALQARESVTPEQRPGRARTPPPGPGAPTHY